MKGNLQECFAFTVAPPKKNYGPMLGRIEVFTELKYSCPYMGSCNRIGHNRSAFHLGCLIQSGLLRVGSFHTNDKHI